MRLGLSSFVNLSDGGVLRGTILDEDRIPFRIKALSRKYSPKTNSPLSKIIGRLTHSSLIILFSRFLPFLQLFRDNFVVDFCKRIFVSIRGSHIQNYYSNTLIFDESFVNVCSNRILGDSINYSNYFIIIYNIIILIIYVYNNKSL